MVPAVVVGGLGPPCSLGCTFGGDPIVKRWGLDRVVSRLFHLAERLLVEIGETFVLQLLHDFLPGLRFWFRVLGPLFASVEQPPDFSGQAESRSLAVVFACFKESKCTLLLDVVTPFGFTELLMAETIGDCVYQSAFLIRTHLSIIKHFILFGKCNFYQIKNRKLINIFVCNT